MKLALSTIEGIENVENHGQKEDGCVKVHVITGEKTDIREQVFYTLADRKLPILFMQYAEKTLEDIFLELTGETAATESRDNDAKEEK